MISIEQAAQERSLIILAGAGVSAGPPAALPSWKALNTAIFMLCETEWKPAWNEKGGCPNWNHSLTRNVERTASLPIYQTSAADLDTDRDDLGLLSRAERSRGGTYVAYPGRPELGAVAQSLIAAHGEFGNVIVADIASFLADLSHGVESSEVPTSTAARRSGADVFTENLSS